MNKNRAKRVAQRLEERKAFCVQLKKFKKLSYLNNLYQRKATQLNGINYKFAFTFTELGEDFPTYETLKTKYKDQISQKANPNELIAYQLVQIKGHLTPEVIEENRAVALFKLRSSKISSQITEFKTTAEEPEVASEV